MRFFQLMDFLTQRRTLMTPIRWGIRCCIVLWALSMSVSHAQTSFPAALDLSATALNGNNGFDIAGELADGEAGERVSSAGDVNGDGIEDFIISAPDADLSGNQRAGKVYVIFGGQSFGSDFDLSTLNGSNGFAVAGKAQNHELGYSAPSAGDVNGDGLDDVLMAASVPSSNGEVYVIFGGQSFDAAFDLSTLNGSNGFTIAGEASGGEFGYSLSVAGDVNGDGIEDFIVGDIEGQGGTGKAYVIFGGQSFGANFDLSTLDGSNGFTVPADTSGQLGWSVSPAGDVNGDGLDDVIMSAPRASVNGVWDGKVYVIFGSQSFDAAFDLSTLNGSNGFAMTGEAIRDQLGRSVSSAGDVNGDGFGDFSVAAPYSNPNELDAAGKVYVIFGGQSFDADFDLSTLNGSNGFTVAGEAQDHVLGLSVPSAGDINGDGIGDLIVAARGADVNGLERVGIVYVIFGGQSFGANFDLSTLDGGNGFTVTGEASGNQLGRSVSSGGDINDDGVEDFILGAPRAAPNELKDAGKVYVLFGGVTGFNQIPQVMATPTSLTFPLTQVSIATVAQTLTVSNPGTGPLTIGALSFTGTHSSDFGLSNDTCSGQTVAINADCTVDVAMTATGPGTRTAGLSIPSNALTTPTTVALSGEAFELGEAVVSISTVDFGSVIVGEPGQAQTFTITNEGPGPLAIGQLVITGAQASDFTIVEDSCSNETLALDEICTVSVQVSASASGSRGATLKIPTDAGTESMALLSQAADPLPVPTLNSWWLALMASLFGFMGWLGLRRH